LQRSVWSAQAPRDGFSTAVASMVARPHTAGPGRGKLRVAWLYILHIIYIYMDIYIYNGCIKSKKTYLCGCIKSSLLNLLYVDISYVHMCIYIMEVM
jgi:hypothetical protein